MAETCRVCVNPRTRRACGRDAVALVRNSLGGRDAVCQKHLDEMSPSDAVSV